MRRALRRARRLICFVLLGLTFLASVAQPAFAGSDFDRIRATGVLRVGTTGDYAPFTIRRPDGHYDGADIVMARRLADAMHVRLEIVPTSWSRLLPDFVERRFDIAMGGVSILPDRSARGIFSRTLLTDGKRPIVRCAETQRYASIAAINRPEVRVVVNPGGSNERFARSRLGQAQLRVHPDNVTIFDEIVTGRADVMVTDGIEVRHQAALHPELCPGAVADPFTTEGKAYLIQPDKALARFVNRWLARLMASGEWSRTLETALVSP